MDKRKILEILNRAQAKGAVVEIKLTVISKANLKEAEKANILADYTKSAILYYSLYKKEKSVSKKMMYGIRLVQELINASNLDKAEEILSEMEKVSGDKKYMGAIWEKRGWIADCRDKWSEEIECFRKAKEIYESIPESLGTEGRKKDRLSTVEHFMARALYFRGKKEDLMECEKLFSKNLSEYKKLKSDDGIAYNYSWLARAYIAMNNLKEAEKMALFSKKYFRKAAKVQGEFLNGYAYRVMSQLKLAKGNKEEAVDDAIESLRYMLPQGTYYNGVIEAVKCIVEASE